MLTKRRSGNSDGHFGKAQPQWHSVLSRVTLIIVKMCFQHSHWQNRLIIWKFFSMVMICRLCDDSYFVLQVLICLERALEDVFIKGDWTSGTMRISQWDSRVRTQKTACGTTCWGWEHWVNTQEGDYLEQGMFLRQLVRHGMTVGEVNEYQGHNESPLEPENQKGSFFAWWNKQNLHVLFLSSVILTWYFKHIEKYSG